MTEAAASGAIKLDNNLTQNKVGIDDDGSTTQKNGSLTLRALYSMIYAMYILLIVAYIILVVVVFNNRQIYI